MQNILELRDVGTLNGSERIELTIKVSSRARCLRVTVYHDGRVVVTRPRFLSESAVEKFVNSRAEWILKKVNYYRQNPPSILMERVPGGLAANKAKALRLAISRLEYFNVLYGFTYRSVRIKDQKTRWGSCSRRGNLNFNYKLALLPPEYLDYVVVHELCHLKELNHSRKFWALVEKTIPDYKRLRREMKKMR